MSSNTQLPYWLGFNQIIAIGPIRFQKILNYFPDIQTAWTAPANDFRAAGLEQSVIEKIISERSKIDTEAELKKVEQSGCGVITSIDTAYPAALKEIYAPPPLLYVLGNTKILQSTCVAIVGSRKMTAYGRRSTELFAETLAENNITIVSGLAYGVDACAHARTLAVSGKTIAVLGSGVHQIYPAANRGLAKKIIESGGAIISEFPLDMPPLKQHFPQRNRIIAGLSAATLVTEAGIKSGSLITASFATEIGRDVFAIPGNIFVETSAGTNQLISSGARVALAPADILEVLHIAPKLKNKDESTLTEIEKIVLGFFADHEWHVDKLAQFARLDISIINATLVQLELKGLIKHIGNQYYCKI